MQVVFGFIELKTHAKMSMVVRREDGKLRTYCHLGTGNYHPITAKIYTDLSYFTCDPEIAHDMANIFNFITGYGEPETACRSRLALYAAPAHPPHIEEEIVHARNGQPGRDLDEDEFAGRPRDHRRALRASHAGVEIDLVVRGICCLRPQVPAFREYPRQVDRRPLPRAQPHLLLRQRPRSAVRQGAGLYRLGRHDAEKPRPPRRNPGSADESDRSRAGLVQIMLGNVIDNQQSYEILPDGTSRRMEVRRGEDRSMRSSIS